MREEKDIIIIDNDGGGSVMKIPISKLKQEISERGGDAHDLPITAEEFRQWAICNLTGEELRTMAR